MEFLSACRILSKPIASVNAVPCRWQAGPPWYLQDLNFAMENPKIRAVEAFPVEQQDQTLICLRDPSGLAPEPIMLGMGAYFIVTLFDGQDVAEGYPGRVCAALRRDDSARQARRADRGAGSVRTSSTRPHSTSASGACARNFWRAPTVRRRWRGCATRKIRRSCVWSWRRSSIRPKGPAAFRR